MPDQMPQATPADNTARASTEPSKHEIAGPPATESDGESASLPAPNAAGPVLPLAPALLSSTPPTIEFELNQDEFDAAMNAMALTGKAKPRKAGRYQDDHDLNCTVVGNCVQFTASVGALTWQTKIPAHIVHLNSETSSFSASFDRVLGLAAVDLSGSYNHGMRRMTIPDAPPERTHEAYFEPGFRELLIRNGEIPDVPPQPQPRPEKQVREQDSRIRFAFNQGERELEVSAGHSSLRISAAAASPHAALALADQASSRFDADVADQLALALEYVRPFAEENSGQVVPRTISVADGSVRGGSHLAISRARADRLGGLNFNIAADAAKPLARLIAKQAGFRFATDGDTALFEGPSVAISVPLAELAFVSVDPVFSAHAAKGFSALVSPISFASAIAVAEMAARPRVPAPDVMIHLSWWQSNDRNVLLVESVEPAGIARAPVDLRAPSGLVLEKEPTGRSRAKQLKLATQGMRPDRWFDLTLSDSAVIVGFDVEGLEVEHALSYSNYDGPGPIRPLPVDYLDRMFKRAVSRAKDGVGAAPANSKAAGHMLEDAAGDPKQATSKANVAEGSGADESSSAANDSQPGGLTAPSSVDGLNYDLHATGQPAKPIVCEASLTA